MDVEGLRWVFKALVGIRGVRWVQMDWDCCRGGSGTDLDGLGWYGMSGMGLEGLGWVRRAWVCCGGTRVGIQGQRIVWGPRMSMGCLIRV